MLRIKIFLIIVLAGLFTQNAKSQFAVDFGVASQSGKFYLDSRDNYTQFFCISPGMLLQGPHWMLRLGIRQSIPRNVKYRDDKGTVTKQYVETLGTLGLGLTFASTQSRTRPYIMFQVARGNATLGTRDSEILQFRFTAGFQFKLKGGLAMYNEASINVSEETPYDTNFAIDLGIRYFFGE